jgi:hypothetical protein
LSRPALNLAATAWALKPGNMRRICPDARS